MSPAHSATRRKLNELQTLYLLKPHFRDVIVEGRDDVGLINWYLREHNVPHAKAFAVDDRVEVPAELVTSVHPEVNARGRVVAVACAVDSWRLSQPAATCIIDSDYDLLEGASRDFGPLLATDYAAMEVYSLDARPLSKFLVAAAKSDIDASSVTSLLKPIWAVIFTLRYVLHRHENGAKLADSFAESCFNKTGEIVLETSRLLRLVQPTPAADRLAELLDLHNKYMELLPEDGLQGIRGHDIAPVLIRFLRLRNDLAQREHVERLLRQSIELRDLDEQPLFQSLLKRVS